jgi:tRNA A22 N-methylase
MKKSFKNQSAAEKFIKKMQDQEDVRGYNMYAEGLEEAKSVKVKTRTGSDKYDYDELLPEVQKIVIMSKHVKKNKRMDLAKKITKDIISGKIKNADISSDLATLIGINQPYTGAAPKAAITDRMKELKLESTELEEALSPAYKKAEFQLYSLEKSLKAGSNLNKDVNKLFGDDFKQEFKNMEKYLGQILDIWEDSIEMAITFGESTELEEAKMSRDYKTAEFQLYSLEKSLKVGSKLNKDVNKILGNDLKREFRKMEKHLRQILDIWEEIEMGITFGESTELEEAKNAIVQH